MSIFIKNIIVLAIVGVATIVGVCIISPSQNQTLNNNALKNNVMEIWKDVKGYEGLYQVSNFGRIKSLPRKSSNRCNSEIILSQHISRCGYYLVSIYLNGKIKTCSSHRLVAEAFLPSKHNNEQVNHINGIKTDNRIENLEWSNNSLNQKHAYKTGLQKCRFNGKFGKDHITSKAVIQYDLNGNFIAEFEGQLDAMRKTGIDNRYISSCCLGKTRTSKGFIWRFKEE